MDERLLTSKTRLTEYLGCHLAMLRVKLALALSLRRLHGGALRRQRRLAVLDAGAVAQALDEVGEDDADAHELGDLFPLLFLMPQFSLFAKRGKGRK